MLTNHIFSTECVWRDRTLMPLKIVILYVEMHYSGTEFFRQWCFLLMAMEAISFPCSILESLSDQCAHEINDT